MSDSPRVDATADITNLTNPPSSLRDSLLRNMHREGSSVSEASTPQLAEPMEIGGTTRELVDSEASFSDTAPAAKRARTHPKSSVEVNGNSILNEVEPALALLPQWQKMTEKAVKAIVSIRFSQVNAFDTDRKLYF